MGAAVLSAARPHAAGERVLLADGRPSGETLLAAGEVEVGNPAESLTVTVGLVQSDRMLGAKTAVLEAVGLAPVQTFPIRADGMPMQLLAYLRLARAADAAQLAGVTFTEDVILSQANEYEVLQLLLGECRERLGAYAGPAEDDVKLLQGRGLDPRARLAAQLRLAEKGVLQGTLDTVRRRLAPIRGVPTKDGALRDANADLLEVFDVLEAIPAAPGKLINGLMAWARGDGDPEYQKRRRRGGGGKP